MNFTAPPWMFAAAPDAPVRVRLHDGKLPVGTVLARAPEGLVRWARNRQSAACGVLLRRLGNREALVLFSGATLIAALLNGGDGIDEFGVLDLQAAGFGVLP